MSLGQAVVLLVVFVAIVAWAEWERLAPPEVE
jgi:hypothetical protein